MISSTAQKSIYRTSSDKMICPKVINIMILSSISYRKMFPGRKGRKSCIKIVLVKTSIKTQVFFKRYRTSLPEKLDSSPPRIQK